MPSENVEKLMQELLQARAVLEPQIEGLKDFARLNIGPVTKQKVTETDARFTKRAQRINEAVAALENLNADDFPSLPTVQVEQAIYDDLQAQVSTIAAAFGKFTGEKASTLGVTLGAPELK